MGTAAVGLSTTQYLILHAAAAAAAAYLALAAPMNACTAQCYSAAHVSLTAHAARVAHRLGGLDDAAMGFEHHCGE